MTATKRFLSGSAASWARIIVTLIAQVVTVPIFLSHWSVPEYGCWLIIQTVLSLSSIFSMGHQNYLGFEFLKIGENQPRKLSLLFYSSIPFAIILSFVEFIAVIILIYAGALDSVFDPQKNMDEHLLKASFLALIMYSFYWIVATSVSALAGRVVATYGYYPRMAWWAVLIAIFDTTAAAVSVMLGASLGSTVKILILVNFVVNIPVFVELFRIFKKNDLAPVMPDWSLGMKIMMESCVLAISSLFDLLRQQGVRVFLSSLVGLVEMTAFSTIKTLSNVALQGIGTITNPMMPELMRYLRNKDQSRLVGSIAFVWLLSLIIMGTCLVALQSIMPIVFALWTRGKIQYDSNLFALFSVGLLIFSTSRPAAAIIQGNNLLKTQIVNSTIVGVICIGGIVILTSTYGIVGAGLALLLAEVVSTILLVFYAQKWLQSVYLVWPWHLFYMALVSLAVTSVAIFSISILPKQSNLILVLSTIFNLCVGRYFFRFFPFDVATKVRGILFPLLGK